MIGFSDYGFDVSNPPKGGFCNSTPTYGEAIKTKFLIGCFGWTGATNSLEYKISLLENGHVNSGVSQEAQVASSILISYGSVSSAEVLLPEGSEALNFMQRLVVRIYDFYGVSAETNFKVQVTILFHMLFLF